MSLPPSTSLPLITLNHLPLPRPQQHSAHPLPSFCPPPLPVKTFKTEASAWTSAAAVNLLDVSSSQWAFLPRVILPQPLPPGLPPGGPPLWPAIPSFWMGD